MSATEIAKLVESVMQPATKVQGKAEIVPPAPKPHKATKAEYQANHDKAGKVQGDVTKATKATKATHTLTALGHWADSRRGRLDTLLLGDGGTVAQLAEMAGCSEGAVRIHLGNLRTQAAGGWTHHNEGVAVSNVNGVYTARIETPKQ